MTATPRQRREYTAKARRKRVRQVTNDLVKATDWRGRLAQSVLDVIEPEERAQ